MAYQFLIERREGAVAYLTLNRPDVRNAFNERVIAELTEWAAAMSTAGGRDGVRVAVLAGAGTTFCAGADASWMAQTVRYTETENIRDARAMAEMYIALDELPIPLVGRVQGAAFGGGAGLAAVCDIVVAETSAMFGFTEVRLGIVPATISPFVLAKIGPSAARELFLTGARFTAADAKQIGLVHVVVSADVLDAAVADSIRGVLASGPEAVAAAKLLIRDVWGRPAREVMPTTTATIARLRVGREGQEGLSAFLEKRKPSWQV